MENLGIKAQKLEGDTNNTCNIECIIPETMRFFRRIERVTDNVQTKPIICSELIKNATIHAFKIKIKIKFLIKKMLFHVHFSI